PSYQRALALALETNNLSDASKWAGDLAQEMTELGNFEQAEKFNEQSRELKLRVHDTASLLHTQLHEGVIASARGEKDQSEKLFLQVISEAAQEPAVLWEAHYGVAELYRNNQDYKKSLDHFDAAVQLIEASQSALTLPDYKITFLARLISFY